MFVGRYALQVVDVVIELVSIFVVDDKTLLNFSFVVFFPNFNVESLNSPSVVFRVPGDNS